MPRSRAPFPGSLFAGKLSGMAEAVKVALVTGAAKRVGRAIVLRLARGGFHVAFTYRTSYSDAQTLVAEATALGRKCVSICADLADLPRAAEAVAKTVQGSFGRLDVLVNNASLYLPGGVPDCDLDLLRRMMAVHVEAPMLLCRRLGPLLAAAGGSIVNMTDLLAERPWPKYAAYCASKAALSNLTLSLARQLAPDVTVNAIAPGVVAWPDDFPESDRREYLKRVPLAREGCPEDVAELVHFLCTAGRYITGQVIRVDGGRSIT